MRELVVEALSRFALHERVYEFAKLGSFGKRAHGARRRIEAPGAVLHRKVLSHAREFQHRLGELVEPDGIEPTTSCLQSRRSPN